MTYEFDRLLSAVQNPAHVTDVANGLRDGRDISEVEALVCVMHALQTGDVESLEAALQPDARCVSKHFHDKGYCEVIRRFRESWQRQRERTVEADHSHQIRPAPYPDLPDWSLGLLLVDKRLAGPTLMNLGRSYGGFDGVKGRYTVELSRQPGALGKVEPLRIASIFVSHFHDLVSGHLIFSGVSCLPSPELLANGSGLQIEATATNQGGYALSIKTFTDSFAVDLDSEDVMRLGKWVRAAAHGVDTCTAYLWQRCQIEFQAIALSSGWVRLLIRSARLEERYDLSAVLPIEELTQRFLSAIPVLAIPESHTVRISRVN